MRVGDIVEYDKRVWRIGLINQSRARLDPVTPNIQHLLGGTFNTYGVSVNVSAGSVLKFIDIDSLPDVEHRRAERLADRDPRSFITDQELDLGAAQPTEFSAEGDETMANGTEEVAMPQATKAKKSGSKPPTMAAPAPQTAADKNRERLAALKAKAQAKPSAGVQVAAPKEPKPKKEKVVRPCVCGCGGQTAGYFVQGHDAKFKSWMVQVERGDLAVKDLPPVVQRSTEFVKNARGGFVSKKNYKGEPHNGYDKAATA